MTDHVICVRRIRNGAFDPEPSEPGTARFLDVPENASDIAPSHENTAKKSWTQNVLEAAKSVPNGKDGDILFYVHGFNTETRVMLERHRKVKAKLIKAGFKGVVVSFDWPSDNKAINYIEDRWDAKKSALKLVEQGIRRFVDYQQDDCEINLHILAHSMGAYVLREAFDDADDVARIASVSWSVSQVMVISGDVSSRSLGANQSKSSSLYRHTVRLTNYFNPYDDVLKLSNVKRVGVSPRVGRVGLPDNPPEKAVNVNCGAYYRKHEAKFSETKYAGHNWYFDDQKFFDDVCATIKGDIDRHLIPTRARGTDDGLHLAP
jgi:esterase/lipase superfamily enzyme